MDIIDTLMIILTFTSLTVTQWVHQNLRKFILTAALHYKLKGPGQEKGRPFVHVYFDEMALKWCHSLEYISMNTTVL